MTYYINPIWFYLTGVSDMARVLFLVFGITSILAGCAAIPVYLGETGSYLNDMSDENRKWVKLFRKVIIIGAILTLIGAFTPSKDTCTKMMIASQVTSENVGATKEEIYNIIDYITEKINGAEGEKKK